MSNSPVAIVTGGAQGIGAAICIELLKEGYRVCIADIQECKVKDFAKRQQSVYGEKYVISLFCDVSNESDFTNVFKETLEKFKRVDVLINNAGILLEQNPRKCMEVNLLGPLIGCNAALKYMGKSSGGKGGMVINTSSASVFARVPYLAVYAATKNGVIGLTRSFGHPYYYDKEGIAFAAFCPFAVDTDLLRNAVKYYDPTMESWKFIDKMSPEFVAKGVLKLLEDRINGSILVVNQDSYNYAIFQDDIQKIISETQ